MAYENIIFDVAEGIATITFNRPKALNALNGHLLDELSAALDEIEADEEIRVLSLPVPVKNLLWPGRTLPNWLPSTPLQGKMFSRKGQLIISRLQELAIPVIAAVNGFALGGGSEMALACDFIYASENAMFGLPEITLGIIPGFGGTQRLPRLIGSNRAKEMIFTGKMIPAAEAEKIGMVNRVLPQASLMEEETLKTARAIAAKGKSPSELPNRRSTAG
jgi:enoyl-CoA hydratase